MTDIEFERKWKLMNVDVSILRHLASTSQVVEVASSDLEIFADSLEFASKMLRVYDKNIRAMIKEMQKLRHDYHYLKTIEYINGTNVDGILQGESNESH